ncbi:peptidase family T4 [Treponema primitia ZAS-2]|uniref:Peptidase family T4 n=1 Tax=Treponema primitia (strain ATCC BAA-887 / DSM 12427 / ZAS-2) TaxID=545694 RepID=F5YMH6_TREPZ|nr:P1 family peptidase [Treponema primitia]AEF86067.1 peptidase family T4 [Treponema primitia ZAS-2]
MTKGIEQIDIRDIAGFRIGQEQDRDAATGCTVIISETGAACGVDVRGGSPGTRDTDALNPVNNRKTVHAVLLAGGSSFGLDAAGGVMRFLEERGIGRDVELTRVPNVCAAILFDLKCGDYRIRPDAAMGYAACENAFRDTPFQSGNFGAGTGATVGKSRGTQFAMKGGIGAAAFRCGDLEAGAIVAVNCVGDVLDGGTIIAGALADDRLSFADSEAVILAEYQENKDFFSGITNSNAAGKNDGNTVLGCIITNANFDKAGATRLAAQGQNGIARRIHPAHSIYDGDTVFALCTGKVAATADSAGILCAAAVEAAILDAIRNARSFGGYIAETDIKGKNKHG